MLLAPLISIDGAWAAGDCAAVPDLSKGDGEFTGPSAQHAVRQAARLADNLIATLRGDPTRPYKHAYAGSVARRRTHALRGRGRWRL